MTINSGELFTMNQFDYLDEYAYTYHVYIRKNTDNMILMDVTCGQIQVWK